MMPQTKRWLKRVIGLIVLAVIYIELESPFWQHLSDQDWIAGYIQQQGSWALVPLLFFGIIFTAVGGPRQLIAALMGFLLGVGWGIMASLFCSLSGAICGYLLARFVLHSSLLRRFPKRLTQFRQFVQYQPFTKILMIRLFPVGSNLVTNLLAGSIAVRFLPFIGASIVGYFPQTLVFALAGAGIGQASRYQFALSIGLGVVSALLGLMLYRNHQHHVAAFRY